MPTAKRNNKGKIICGPTEIEKLLAEDYKNRLRKRPVRPILETMKLKKNNLLQQKLNLAANKKTIMWTMKELDKALADLKTQKSRDSEGLVNEIFKF